MRRMISKRLLALAAALCLIVSMMPTSVQASEADTVKYVALGDSITTGYGLGPADKAFPAILASEMEVELQNMGMAASEVEVELQNMGMAGATSNELLRQLSGPDMKPIISSADIITITIGGNDLMYAFYEYLAAKWESEGKGKIDSSVILGKLEKGDPDTIKFAGSNLSGFIESEQATTALSSLQDNFPRIIASIREMNPTVAIVVSTQYNPYKYVGKNYNTELQLLGIDGVKLVNSFGTIVNILSETIESSSEKLGYIVADVNEAFEKSEDNLCNAGYNGTSFNLDFHPNAEGHKLIAETFVGKIVDVVSETFNSISSGVKNLSNASVAQADITSAEQAKAWAESQLKSVIPAGVSSEVVISGFVPATAGTAQNKEGTDGSFKVAVTLDWLGTSTQPVEAEVSIQATAYTEPAVNPGSGEDVTGTVDNNKNETPAAQNTKKPAKTTYVSPQTGDSTVLMPYVVLLLAAAAAAAAAVTARRKMSGR